jgi:hypothetical protein
MILVDKHERYILLARPKLVRGDLLGYIKKGKEKIRERFGSSGSLEISPLAVPFIHGITRSDNIKKLNVSTISAACSF